MNPWAFYKHKPQLLQALAVAAVTWFIVRREHRAGGPRRRVFLAMGAWALVGVLDYLVYAFGSGAQGIASLQETLEWARVAVVLVGVVLWLDTVQVSPPKPKR